MHLAKLRQYFSGDRRNVAPSVIESRLGHRLLVRLPEVEVFSLEEGCRRVEGICNIGHVLKLLLETNLKPIILLIYQQ